MAKSHQSLRARELFRLARIYVAGSSAGAERNNSCDLTRGLITDVNVGGGRRKGTPGDPLTAPAIARFLWRDYGATSEERSFVAPCAFGERRSGGRR